METKNLINNMKTKIIKKAQERIYLDKNNVQEILSDISYRRHIERYGMIRQWCFGNVVDFACGCGYGSWMISHNPDVNKVYGFDIDTESIDWANNNFTTENVEFFAIDVKKIDVFLEPKKIDSVDVLVSLETIEHIDDKYTVPIVADKCKAKNVIVSFPSKKSTHFNQYHKHDFRTQDLLDVFENYVLVEEIEIDKEIKILRLARKYNL